MVGEKLCLFLLLVGAPKGNCEQQDNGLGVPLGRSSGTFSLWESDGADLMPGTESAEGLKPCEAQGPLLLSHSLM